jgi:hypothetical protein
MDLIWADAATNEQAGDVDGDVATRLTFLILPWRRFCSRDWHRLEQ